MSRVRPFLPLIVFFLLCVAVAFTGCADPDVYPYHVTNAAKACESRGGWVQLSVRTGARCADGTYVNAGTVQEMPEVK